MLTVSLLLWFCLFWIFSLRIFLFKNFQGCIAVYLSRFCCLLSRAATHTEYHEFFPLSITFLKFFDIFLPSGLCSRTVDFYNKTSFFHCQYLRIIFFIIFLNYVSWWRKCLRWLQILNLTEDAYSKKSGASNGYSWFMTLAAKRRKRDLNPRAGCPTYTLSRGASSASWVFLQELNSYFKLFNSRYLSNARVILS